MTMKRILGKRAKRSFFRKTRNARSRVFKQLAGGRIFDEKTSEATILNTHAGGRILRLESGLSKETSACAERCPLFCKASAEIRLMVYHIS